MRRINKSAGLIWCEIEGLSLEKILQTLRRNGVCIYDVKRICGTKVLFVVDYRYKDYISDLAADGGYVFKIRKMTGVSKYLHNIWRRTLLIVGICVSIIALIMISQRVFLIDVEGSDEINREEIQLLLKEYGVEKGAIKNKINKNQVENALMMRFPQLSWTGIELRGIRATVRMKSLDVSPEIIDWVTASDIFSDFDCVITKLEVLQGESLVEVGETVKKGQKIIDGGGRAAVGKVYADVWYSADGAAMTETVETEFTGKNVQMTGFLFKGTELLFDEREIPFEHYSLDVNCERIGGSPVVWCNITANEIVYVTKRLDEKEVKYRAYKKAEENIKEKTNGMKIETTKEDYIVKEGMITARIFACVSQRIDRQIKRE